ncbi:flagellar hook assembly protein FlgD [Terricaulis silvestris]|uniref:Basal-body rod modification protein FlgD n=1 Tax=Terricaulis silvestris TaxID=2686094 RepID=A0A6I6MIM9_9CAUL|nr:flagellar hook assembly protein FlgD [Terricaulis silvestris]QGZ93601.1 Basal-body rod modification protein FlgD [Terricaulis silvestris]
MAAIPPVSTETQSDAGGSRTRLSDNYDTFLILLTAQLQNQDPLAPMDSTQFTQQLVQFSQVEQQIRTNEQLEGLVGQYQAASAGAALSYLGKDAIIEADETYLAGGEANWAYRMPETATDLTITVKDSSGRAVYETTTADRGAGEHLFTWDGKKTNGEIAADGVYTIGIEAENAAGTSITPTISVRETIMGVDFSGAAPVVITPSGTRSLDTIRSVLDVS